MKNVHYTPHQLANLYEDTPLSGEGIRVPHTIQITSDYKEQNMNILRTWQSHRQRLVRNFIHLP
jgi:hypothetical protein